MNRQQSGSVSELDFQIAKELHQDKDFTLLIIEHETEEALKRIELWSWIMGGCFRRKTGRNSATG